MYILNYNYSYTIFFDQVSQDILLQCNYYHQAKSSYFEHNYNNNCNNNNCNNSEKEGDAIIIIIGQVSYLNTVITCNSLLQHHVLVRILHVIETCVENDII